MSSAALGYRDKPTRANEAWVGLTVHVMGVLGQWGESWGKESHSFRSLLVIVIFKAEPL